MNASDGDIIRVALTADPRLGFRIDCVGEEQRWWKNNQAKYPAFADRWKTAPLVGEWCNSKATTTPANGLRDVKADHFSNLSSGNFPWTYDSLSAADKENFEMANKLSGYRYAISQVRVGTTTGDGVDVSATWQNAGVAPTYDNWRVTYEFRDASGKVITTVPSTVNLKSILPGEATINDRLSITLPAGTYDLHVVVADPQGYLAPMNLALTGRTGEGSYPLGTVALGAVPSSSSPATTAPAADVTTTSPPATTVGAAATPTTEAPRNLARTGGPTEGLTYIASGLLLLGISILQLPNASFRRR